MKHALDHLHILPLGRVAGGIAGTVVALLVGMIAADGYASTLVALGLAGAVLLVVLAVKRPLGSLRPHRGRAVADSLRICRAAAEYWIREHMAH